MTDPESYVNGYIEETEQLMGRMTEECGDQILRIAETVIEALREGGTVYFCGNGGSAADAQHMASELVGQFEQDRAAIPAAALTTDTSLLTAVSNDYGFPYVFERQVDGLMNSKDVLVAISTSGTSENVVRAARAAREKNCSVVGFTGASGGDLASICDETLTVPSDQTAHVQEGHLLAGHILCGIVEDEVSE